jgi:glucuronate isomerase
MSMPGFLHADVLLSTSVSRRLYHDVAARCPIVDVHNHLAPDEIANDRVWPHLTALWLDGDHYKWRAMRGAGVPEQLITGDADPYDRFVAWANTLPRLVRNPLYLWTHLELRRVFGIDMPLDGRSAPEIWAEANRQLPGWSAQTLLAHFDVRLVATTDGPPDRLEQHQQHQDRAPRTAMVPTLRPDAAYGRLGDPESWNRWADDLALSAGHPVDDLASLLAALTTAWDRFALLGCRASDHGIARLPDMERNQALADTAIRGARAGRPATANEIDAVLLEVVTRAAEDARRDDAVLQLHLGPQRNASPRLWRLAGPDVGTDVMNDERQGPGLTRFLAALEHAETLPRTIIYNLNPADNALFAAVAGAFGRDGVPGVVQWGPPWWFNDTEVGMRRALDDLSSIGQLGSFVGMLTDSRSILSMTRHELFRRIACDAIGTDVEAGRIPDDPDLLNRLVADLCVGNAVRFFGFDESLAAPR